MQFIQGVLVSALSFLYFVEISKHHVNFFLNIHLNLWIQSFFSSFSVKTNINYECTLYKENYILYLTLLINTNRCLYWQVIDFKNTISFDRKQENRQIDLIKGESCLYFPSKLVPMNFVTMGHQKKQKTN